MKLFSKNHLSVLFKQDKVTLFLFCPLMARIFSFLFDVLTFGIIYLSLGFYLEENANLIDYALIFTLYFLILFCAIPSLLKGTLGQCLFEVKSMRSNADEANFFDYLQRNLIIIFPFIVHGIFYLAYHEFNITLFSPMMDIWLDIGMVWLCIMVISVTFSGGRQGLHDKISKTRLIQLTKE